MSHPAPQALYEALNVTHTRLPVMLPGPVIRQRDQPGEVVLDGQALDLCGRTSA
jgi:hypothetical protein